jgi:fusaric acid resistance family protein
MRNGGGTRPPDRTGVIACWGIQWFARGGRYQRDPAGPAGHFAAIPVEPENARPERHAWRLRRGGGHGRCERTKRASRSRGKVTGWLRQVFELNPAGLNWPRAVLFLDVALVPLVVFWVIGYEQYLLSALFGLLFAWLDDPGGGYGYRASHIAVFALIGAGVTALGFGIGGDAWGWLVLAAFAVTLAAGLAVTFGVRRFVTALLLILWFIVTLGIAFSFHHHVHITSYTWAQVLAWAGGAALWIAVTFIAWLIRGRRDRPQPIAELPGDTARRKLTRPLAMFAVIRALVIVGAVALAFGLNLSHGYWMPIAAMVAMKPSLQQATLVAVQRLVGALIGAAAAALLLLIPASETGSRLFAITLGLEVVAIVLFMHGAAVRFWNYALYTGAIAAGVLTLIDLPQPSNYSAEGYRLLWTLCGVGIGVVVMLLAGLLTRRTAKTPPQPAPQPA